MIWIRRAACSAALPSIIWARPFSGTYMRRTRECEPAAPSASSATPSSCGVVVSIGREAATPQELGLADDALGAAGSHSRVRRMYVPEKGRAQMIEGSAAEQAARLIQIIREATGA